MTTTSTTTVTTAKPARRGPATHYVPAEQWEAKKASGSPLFALMLRATCGARSTNRATLYYTTKPERVDCLRCLAKMA